MPQFDVDTERINVFPVDDQYLFTHYFDRTDVFEELSEYYNEEQYRFEIPADEFDHVREFLGEEYYDPAVVDELERFCVVKEKYTEHADILKNSVVNWERRGHLFFLMKAELSIKEALEHGATRLKDTDFVLGI